MGEVPVGSIIAWYPTAFGKTDPPAGWERCDGQVIVRQDDGGHQATLKLPDLNGALAGTAGTAWPDGHRMFLRGSTKSGIPEEEGTKRPKAEFTTAATQGGHKHAVPGGDTGSPIDTVFQNGGNGRNFSISVDAGEHAHSITGGGDPETRPVNMSVVWIMRVK